MEKALKVGLDGLFLHIILFFYMYSQIFLRIILFILPIIVLVWPIYYMYY